LEAALSKQINQKKGETPMSHAAQEQGCRSESECDQEKYGCSEKESTCEKTERCPVECAVEAWKGAFHRAFQEVLVGLLKERIQKRWGEGLAKQADAQIAAAEACFQARLAQGKAEAELRAVIAEVFKGLSG
jgi:hypothetical protein